MDNDQQVNDLVQVTRERFLNQPLDTDSHEESFDLEREFARSAKNRSLLVPLVCGAFFLVLLAGAVTASVLADMSSQQATVKIGQFDDLKLRDLFDSAKKNQRDLEQVQQQMNKLLQESNDRKETIRQDAKSQLDLLTVSGFAADVIQKKTDEINSGMNAALRRETVATAALVNPLKSQAEAIQKKIDNYDGRIGKLNQQNQERLDSQQKLFEIQLDKTKAYYDDRIARQTREQARVLANLKNASANYLAAVKARQADEIRRLILKYNPKVKDADVVAILDAYQKSDTPFLMPQLPANLLNGGVVRAEDQQSLADRVTKLQRLLSVMHGIPYENSVPGVLHSLDVLTTESFQNYDAFLSSASTQIDTQKATITDLQTQLASSQALNKNYETGFQTLLSANGKTQDGVLLDVHDPKSCVVWIKPDRPVAVGDTYSIRNQDNNDDLGSLKIVKTAGTVLAEILEQKNFFRAPKVMDKLQFVPPQKP